MALQPVLPISPSPAIENVAAAALRERRLRLEAIARLEENFRAGNDNLPGDNRSVAAVEAALFADTLPVSATDLFLAQLLAQQIPGESGSLVPLSIDAAALAQPGVASAFGSAPYLNFYSQPITPYGVPVVQNFLV